jgi:hypothetical protein
MKKMHIVKTTLFPSPSAASMASGSSNSRTRSMFEPRRISSTNVRLLKDLLQFFVYTDKNILQYCTMYSVFEAHNSASTKKFCYDQVSTISNI